MPLAMVFLHLNDPLERRILMIFGRLLLVSDEVELSIGWKHADVLGLAFSAGIVK